MHIDDRNGLEKLADRPVRAGARAPAVPALDPADYAEDMAAFDMSEDQKREFLETLWSIMRAFAEMGFSVDLCGQLFAGFNEAAGAERDGVEFDHSTQKEKPSAKAGKESSP